MIVSYRANGIDGTTSVATHDLSIAFNRVARDLVERGYIPQDFGKQVRIAGKVKIERKRYDAVMQAGLIVVAQGPHIPDRVELKV